MQKHELDSRIWWVESANDEYAKERSWLSHHYRVNVVNDRNATIADFRQKTPDLVLLPAKSFLLMHELRAETIDRQVPAIVLACEDRETDCLEALDVGAEDYLLAPFSLRELLTRVKVNLKIARQNRVGNSSGKNSPPARTDSVECDRADKRQTLQYRVAGILAEAADGANPFSTILQLLCENLGWQASSIWSASDRERMLRCLDAWQASDPILEDFGRDRCCLSLAFGEGLPGRVWATGRHIWIKDLVKSPDFPLAGISCSAIAFPIEANNQTIGVIEAFGHSLQPPERNLLETISAIGTQIGQFIERQRADRARQESEERFHLATRAVMGMVYDWDLKTNEVYRSEGLHHLIGVCAEDVPPTREWWIKRIHPEDLGLLLQAFEPLQTELCDRYEFEYRVCHEDGRWLHVWDRAYLMRDSDGALQRVVGYTADITKRKQDEEALRQSEEFNRRVLDSTSECIKVLDLEGRLLYMNPKGQQLMKIEDLTPYLDSNWLDFWQGADRNKASEAIAAANSRGVGQFRGYCPTVTGTPKWWEVTITPLLDARSRVERLVCISFDITERFAAEEALKESEARFRHLADTAPVLVWMSGTDKLYNYFNQTWLDFSGRTLEQELGDGWSKGIHPEEFERYLNTYIASFDARERFEIEYRLRDRNGQYRWILDIGVPRFTPEGNFLGYIGSCIDIQERKIAEELLQETKERLRLALRASQTIAWDMNLSTRRVVCSENALQLWGFQEGTAEEFLKAIHPDDRASLIQAWERSVSEGESYSIEYRVIALDGNIRWLRSQGQVYLDCKGKPERLIGVTLDITNLVEIREALEESEARFRWIFESNIIALAFWNIDGNIVDANDAYLKLIGYTREEMHDRKFCWSVISTPEYNELHLKIFEELQQFGRSTPVKTHYIHKAGHRVPVLVGSALRQGSHYDGVAFAIDLTERELVDREREGLLEREKNLREAAESANRIKDEFLAVLSHELRTPLNPILGWSQLLRKEPSNLESLHKGLETIERNVKLQIQLIDDLLDVSRILRGKLHFNIAPIDLVATVNIAIETLSFAARAKSIQIERDVQIDRIWVMGDEGRLQQVVWNLISNAIKFTPSQGRVEVRVLLEDKMVTIRVRDTGLGIAPDFLPYVFEQFRQADSSITRKFGGLGLGLAIVRYLVELHGGTVKAESPGLGQGATFSVTLPLSTSDCQTLPEPKEPDRVVHLDGMRILVIDDDPSTLELLVVALEESGAIVTIAESAKKGLIALEMISFHLLLSDISMPEIDGYSFIRQVRSQPPEKGGNIPAIALSAHAAESDRQMALRAGFQSHLAKPVDIDYLIRSIARFAI